MQQDNKSPFKVENWIVDPAFNRLVLGEETHRVEPKAMGVLLQLAARARHVVTKDEILGAVWPDTYVGEDALPRCISMLRHVFRDDPHHPRFIQTVSKVGYCLLFDAVALTASAAEITPNFHSPHPVTSTAVASDPSPSFAASGNREPSTAIQEKKRRSRLLAVGVPVVVVVVALLWAVHSLRRVSASPSFQTLLLTTNAGEQSRPAFSPDGKRVAFVWAKEGDSSQHIYIKELGSETAEALSGLSDREYDPVWSPDGKQIAFLSSSAAGLGLYVSSFPPSGSIRKVYIPGVITGWQNGALAWSPDGKTFLLADHVGGQPSSSIYEIDLANLRVRALTSPPPGWEGDMTPSFSPDGEKIAFVRASESEVTDLYWILAAGGEPHQITHDGKLIHGIAWSTDSQSIIFSSNRAGQPALWKVAATGGAPARLPVGTEDATQPAVSAKGDHLAFVQSSAIFGILRITGSRGWGVDHDSNLTSRTVICSTAEDSAPSASPDGTQFSFQSWRSGSQQIWLASISGQSLRQLTPNSDQVYFSGSPSWSPQGAQIAFDARRQGHAHIFVISTSGGVPRQLTFGDVNDIVPRWSVDARFIYFRSNRGGRWQLWKIPATGGAPAPVTREDGIVGQESPDGKWLYFARGGESGIWRMPTAGGEEVRILDQPAPGYWGYWAVGKDGIYFLDQSHSTVKPSISFYDTATKKITQFAHLQRLPPLYSGISTIPGTHDLLMYNQRDAERHIAMTQGARRF